MKTRHYYVGSNTFEERTERSLVNKKKTFSLFRCNLKEVICKSESFRSFVRGGGNVIQAKTDY